MHIFTYTCTYTCTYTYICTYTYKLTYAYTCNMQKAKRNLMMLKFCQFNHRKSRQNYRTNKVSTACKCL